ncbi:MAG: hypothetical protein QM766_22235 [Burkholderiaceae bacterium]
MSRSPPYRSSKPALLTAAALTTLLVACGGGGAGGDNGAAGNNPGASPGTPPATGVPAENGGADTRAPVAGVPIAWEQNARIRADHPYRDDWFGSAVLLSDDGSTLAIAAPNDKSDATTINGDETDRSPSTTTGSGAIHVYARAVDGSLTRQAYLKPPGGNSLMSGNSARLGRSFGMSPDGSRIVAGAPTAKGAEIDFGSGLGGTEYGFGAGRLAVFDRAADGQWTLKSWTAVADGRQSDQLGASVVMSADGRWVMAGAPHRAYGEVKTPADYANDLTWSGAAYLFGLSDDGRLQQMARLRAPFPAAMARYGAAVAITGDGEWIAVTAYNDSTDPATGTPTTGDPKESGAYASGAVHLYRRGADGIPIFVRTLKSPAPRNQQNFGSSVAFSRDGSRLAIGADMGTLIATGEIVGLPPSYIKPGPGDVYVYRREGADYVLEASLTPEQPFASDTRFGATVSLDASGSVLAIGMVNDMHAGGGADAYRFQSGSARVYARAGQSWSAASTLRPETVSSQAYLGISVSLSGDGRLLAAGADGESTPGAGINPGTTGQTLLPAGAAYLFRR